MVRLEVFGVNLYGRFVENKKVINAYLLSYMLGQSITSRIEFLLFFFKTSVSVICSISSITSSQDHSFYDSYHLSAVTQAVLP